MIYDNLTKEEMLFLHLFRFNSLKDDHVVPNQLTQHGIQDCLGCDISLISRLLKKNEENGYIYHHLSLVKNKKRKQYAYFLTRDGIEFAKELERKYPGISFRKNSNNQVQKLLREY